MNLKKSSCGEKFNLDWNYHSNHIEGNTLTYGGTKLLLLCDKTQGKHNFREYQEMSAHDVAIQKIQEYAKEKERFITESDIRDLNKIILVKNFLKYAITLDGQNTQKEIQVGKYKRQPKSCEAK